MKAFFHKKNLLWLFCILGSLAPLPYALSAGIVQVAMPLWQLILIALLNSSILFGLICWLSSKIVPKTDIHPFLLENPLQRIVYPGIFGGIFLGFVLYFLDKTVFASSLLSGQHPPFWVGAIASIYGAVNEEVLTRLFLLTLIYFLLRKCLPSAKRTLLLWGSTVVVALLFGLGHLPALFKLAPPSGFEIFRVLFLNGIAGVVFGWLYWSRGLWTAMLAHFITDLMIHVFLI